MAAELLIISLVVTKLRHLLRLLQDTGFRVNTVDPAEKGRTAARVIPPDVIIIVGNPDDKETQSLCRGFSLAPDTADIPIMVAATSPFPCWEPLFDCGASDIVTDVKEFNVILARLRALVRYRMRSLDLSAGADFMNVVSTGLSGIELAEHQKLGNRVLSVGRHHITGTAQPGLTGITPLPIDHALDFHRVVSLSDRRNFDLVVLDLDHANPGAGLELIPWLRTNPKTRNCVILCIGSPAGGAGTLALDLGADDVAPAPASAAEVRARASALLRRKHRLDRLRGSLRDGLKEAMTDPLTRLHNRRYATDRLSHMLDGAARRGESLAVLMIDIDNFKRINDTFGHAAGDRVLVKVSSWLRNLVRAKDLLARFGGEEFIIGLPSTDLADAEEAAERIRRSIESAVIPFHETAPQGRITVSLGVAVSRPAPFETLDDLIARADSALYKSKAAGRNCVHLNRPVAA